MMDSPPVALPSSDQLIASAAQYLIEGNDAEAANIVLACQLERIDVGSGSFSGDRTVYGVYVQLRGPRAAYDSLKDYYNPVGSRIREAFRAALPEDTWLEDVSVRFNVPTLDPEWRDQLLDQASGKSVNNQAVEVNARFSWQGFRFRSPAEQRIAEALDRTGVMFFPLCRARLSQGPRRVNREPDFLVCHQGNWGMLEVDGDAWHPPTRAVQDHERDRFFRSHGIKVVERYAGKQCMEIPEMVVKSFLEILENNG